MPELLNANYKDFLKFYRNFSLINSEKALDYIESI